MWGGRFGGGPAAIMQEINASIPVDKRLWEEDIAASRAHAAMLGAAGIIGADDAVVIDRGLAQIAEEFAANGVPVDLALEDIHMTVESRLKELVGEAAGRLHTARSRNDQVATDFRLWTRTACERIDAGLTAIQAALLARADEHASSIMPGFTHLQVAQPVTLGHHLLAYVEMFGRDRSRFADAVSTAICAASPCSNIVSEVGRKVLSPRSRAITWTSPGMTMLLTLRPSSSAETSTRTISTSPLPRLASASSSE